jgi:ATP-binding cassette subfamily F protein uup
MHYNFVSKLSGGEKRRLKLMTVLMKNPNFLILDEPTNDLDIFVMSVLEDYLRSFQGCLIVVSHDRYFMDKMVDHMFVFKGDGEISDILGNYTEYRKNILKEGKDANKYVKEEVTVVEKKPEPPKEKKKLSFKERQEFEGLEKDMENLEKEKSEMTTVLSDEAASNEDLMKAGERLSKVVAELGDKEMRWLELSEYE